MMKTAWLLAVLAMILAPVGSAWAGSSTIVVAEGYACMGADKSTRQTEQEARADAKRIAAENAKTYIKASTEVEDQTLKSDLVNAYTRATVTVLEEYREGTGWYKDDVQGRCYRLRIKAEVVPDEAALARLAKAGEAVDDPAAPLAVKIWTEKNRYRQGEAIKVYLKGNRPFYARVLYKDASGSTLQILPNPYRQENYFRGGVVYEIPEVNRDRFTLEVTPPFGSEKILLHASSSPLGDLELRAAGGVYDVKTRGRDIAIKSRGVKISGVVKAGAPPVGAAFTESVADVTTAAQ